MCASKVRRGLRVLACGRRKRYKARASRPSTNNPARACSPTQAAPFYFVRVRASAVLRTNGPILARAQASRPEIGYSGKRPANRNGGPSELTHANFANVLGEQGTLCVSTTYLAAGPRRRCGSFEQFHSVVCCIGTSFNAR